MLGDAGVAKPTGPLSVDLPQPLPAAIDRSKPGWLALQPDGRCYVYGQSCEVTVLNGGMSGKVLGPSDRAGTSSRGSDSPTTSNSPSLTKTSPTAAKLSSEGLSPKQSPEKAKGEAKPKSEKAGSSKPKGKSGKTRKDGKEQDDLFGAPRLQSLRLKRCPSCQ
eukprot:Skav218503  [mRNA]  locus=scaffold3758:197967:210722:+ [translate_table: standard]